MATSNATKAGVAIFFGAVQWAMVILISEIMDSNYVGVPYAGLGNATGYMYSVSSNYISDLGATCRGSTCTIPPSGYLFDGSLVVLGLSVLVAAYFLHRAFHLMPASVLFVLVGVGAAGAGIFPETAGIAHHIFTLIGFLSAGLAALVSARLAKKPMFYVSIILGLITLVALVFYVGDDFIAPGKNKDSPWTECDSCDSVTKHVEIDQFSGLGYRVCPGDKEIYQERASSQFDHFHG
jgi:hypothetical membrane protein